MKYYGRYKQMNLSDRMAIEMALCNKEKLKTIAKRLGRHPTTISNEIKQNRTFIKGYYYLSNDCRKAKSCARKHICGDAYCNGRCVRCRIKDCHQYCDAYVSRACERFLHPPYVCNGCLDRANCTKDRYMYVAKFADAASERRRSESRQGSHLKGRELKELDELVSELVMKGQPLAHIYAEHSEEIPVSLRTVYNYIENQTLSIRNIDLRRKTRYKLKRKRQAQKQRERFWKYREGRTYDDYLIFMKQRDDSMTVEMDTVKGVRETGKRLLTMIFRKNSVMLLFLMPDGTAESVKSVFDYLYTILGTECFQRLFPVILTDNGSEFKRVDDLEMTSDFEYRTTVFYCDPMASWQKPHIEKNHEYIRYVIPRGRSLNKYTQDDITLLMNHINSIKRPGLENRSPYELAEDDEDMQQLMHVLKMHPVKADEVHLKPDLFNKL